MIIKVNQPIKDYEGKVVKNEGKELSLKIVLINALNFISPQVKSTVEDKLRAYKLSIEVMTKDEVDFKVEDLVKIKENINQMYTPLVVGQVVMIIEGGKEVKIN